jgi:cell wall assembly regulator SMI1
VSEVWQRIISWLEQHAPVTHGALLPGATTNEIIALEQALGLRIPAVLRALWLLCAGAEDTPGAALCPIAAGR